MRAKRLNGIILENKNAGAFMKRDMDLIRRILLKIEESDGSEMNDIDFDGVDALIVAFHFRLIDDAGFILRDSAVHSAVTQTTGGSSIGWPELSWEGCEFINSIRDDSVWKSVKAKLSILKDAPIQIIQALAIKAIESRVGLD